jgi:membrane protease YdiL (CAAX protease family)
LAALLWPTVRGVPWRRVRNDIGLFAGKRPIREILWGVVCYVSNLPLLAIGLLVTFALMGIYSALTGDPGDSGPIETPTHPVVQWVQEAGWIGRLQIVTMACLIAPLVEETIFRGVLYRHLREGTCRWPTGVSIALSVGITSLIFAVIHPQGLMAIPALMAVATGLSLAREWRGSLVAPIVMHATNNGVLMMMMFALV